MPVKRSSKEKRKNGGQKFKTGRTLRHNVQKYISYNIYNIYILLHIYINLARKYI
jgi:hypothetical protein